MTLTRIATADMGDSFDCWAGDGPQATALHARATATANPGLIEEFQGRVADEANAWLADHARDTTSMTAEDEREVEQDDYNDAMRSVDVEAIAADLLADDGDEALSESIRAGVAAVLDSVAEHPGSFALLAADDPEAIAADLLVETTVTAVVRPNVADGIDHIYVFGAQIADPNNNPAVTWDDSVTPSAPVFVIEVPSSEDEQPYRDALDEHGLAVIGTDGAGDWMLDQRWTL